MTSPDESFIADGSAVPAQDQPDLDERLESSPAELIADWTGTTDTPDSPHTSDTPALDLDAVEAELDEIEATLQQLDGGAA